MMHFINPGRTGAVAALFSILLALALPVPAAFSQGPPGGMPPAKVVVRKVAEKEIAKTLAVVGTVDFDRISDVTPELSGKILRHFLAEGKSVKAGDPLVVLDTELKEKEIEVLEKQVKAIDASLENSDRNVDRYKGLYDKGIVSEQTYDDEVYKNRELTSSRDSLVKQMEKLQIEVEKSTIRAPFDGMILEKFGDVGEWAKPDEAVCVVASTSDVYVSVSVLEDAVRFISPGDTVTVDFTALGRQVKGTVMRIVPVAEVRSRNFIVKVKVPYYRLMIRNMSAVVHVPTSPRMKLRVIPRDALVKMGDKNFVYTVKDGKSAILPINIVSYLGDSFGVDDQYIVAGMPVVVEGNARLMPDAPVEVTGGN